MAPLAPFRMAAVLVVAGMRLTAQTPPCGTDPSLKKTLPPTRPIDFPPLQPEIAAKSTTKPIVTGSVSERRRSPAAVFGQLIIESYKQSLGNGATRHQAI